MTHKMFMLITYITCFAIYLATQQCINFYFRGNISSFMTENNSSRFFWTPGTCDVSSLFHSANVLPAFTKLLSHFSSCLAKFVKFVETLYE